MTIIATRDISQPDRHSFYNAYPQQDQAQTAVDILQGVTLVIGTVTMAAPTASRIYEAFRVNTDRAVALRIYTDHMRGATTEDLEDFIYLLDDTLSGAGVPGMGRGQEWTITYQTTGGAPNQSLLNRLRDRQASYGNFAHYQAIAGSGGAAAEGAIRIVYDRTSAVSVQARQDQLARLLQSFFEAEIPAARDAATTSPEFQQVFNNGYVSYTNIHFREGEMFFSLIAGLEYIQRSGAAHTAITRLASQIQASRRSQAESGAIQFVEDLIVLVTLYENIRGQGVGTHALTADLLSGFTQFDTAAKNQARHAARQWRVHARSVVGSATLSRQVQVHLNHNIDACFSIYATALYNPAQLPQNMSGLYYSYLHTNPTDIWGAYTVILVPTSRRMGDRMAHIILASWDPTSGRRPQGLAASIASTLRTLAGLE